MSTLTATAPAPSKAPAGAFGRVVNVVRLILANPMTTITMPWMILGIIFAANWVIWWIIQANIDPSDAEAVSRGTQWSGASTFIFVYMTVVAIQAINLTFPLALGFGVTRRDFWLGSSLTWVLLSAMYTAGLTILSTLEEVTGGWGLHGRMFTSVYFGTVWYERMFVFFTLMMFCFFFGSAIASVYVRWKAFGVTAFFVAVGAVLIGLVALFTFTQSWPAVAEFFIRNGFIGSFAWSYVLTAIAAVVGFLILQRATPKS